MYIHIYCSSLNSYNIIQEILSLLNVANAKKCPNFNSNSVENTHRPSHKRNPLYGKQSLGVATTGTWSSCLLFSQSSEAREPKSRNTYVSTRSRPFSLSSSACPFGMSTTLSLWHVNTRQTVASVILNVADLDIDRFSVAVITRMRRNLRKIFLDPNILESSACPELFG